MMTAGLSCGVAVAIIYRYLVRRERHGGERAGGGGGGDCAEWGGAEEDRI